MTYYFFFTKYPKTSNIFFKKTILCHSRRISHSLTLVNEINDKYGFKYYSWFCVKNFAVYSSQVGSYCFYFIFFAKIRCFALLFFFFSRESRESRAFLGEKGV